MFKYTFWFDRGREMHYCNNSDHFKNSITISGVTFDVENVKKSALKIVAELLQAV